MKKRKWIYFVTALVVVGVVFAVVKKKKNRNGAQGAMTRKITVKLGDIEETVDASGEVSPLNRVEVKPPIQGRIEKILVDEGSTVKAGQILAWMSSSDRAAILDAARAKGLDEVKKWEDTYKPTPLVAPLSGVIILRNVVVGQTVDVGTVLFALSDKLIVVAHVDEVDIGRVHVEMPARITLDAYPQDPITGTVFSILHEGVNVSNVITYGVKIEPKNAPAFFRSQMTANINLIVNQKKDVLTVPATAVSDTANGEKQVLVPGPDQKPVSKIVKTGIETNNSVEIVDGLAVGDTVLVTSKRYSPQQAQAGSPLVMGGSGRR
jgi:macrolide-specific efflux system membrane fusion protein